MEPDVRRQMPAAPAAPVMAPSAATARAARITAAGEEETGIVPEQPAAPAATRMRHAERHSTEMVKPALASAAELTSVRGSARSRRRPVPPPDTALPRLDEMNPRQALNEWLDQRAARVTARPATAPPPAPAFEEPAPVVLVEEAAPVAAHEPEPVSCAPLVEPVVVAVCNAGDQPEPVLPLLFVEPAPVAADDIRLVLRRALAKRIATPPAIEVPPVVAAAPAPVKETAPVASEAVIAKPAPVIAAAPAQTKTVSVFLSTRKIDSIRRETPVEPTPRERAIADELELAPPPAEPRFEIIDGAALANSLEVALPGGMHDHAVLDRAISTGKRFRGLVIAVGVNDVEGRTTRNNDLMQSIGFFIRGLIAEKEFACRAGESEFLIVCPGVEGSQAQQRLNQIAEQLWDYQLRGVSAWSVLFSWGGADVHYERLPEAIAIANERMNQTRRGRKTVSVESARPWRKQAV